MKCYLSGFADDFRERVFGKREKHLFLNLFASRDEMVVCFFLLFDKTGICEQSCGNYDCPCIFNLTFIH